jgi:hypothetical protein
VGGTVGREISGKSLHAQPIPQLVTYRFYYGGETGIRTPGRIQVIEITSGLLYLTEMTTVPLILHGLSSLAGSVQWTSEIDTKSTPRRLQGLRPSIELAVELVILKAIAKLPASE